MISKFYRSTSLQTLFRKSQFTIFAITFLICTFTLASISVFTVESYAKQNLILVSKTVVDRIQPSLVFKDQASLNQIINDYTLQHSIRLIQVFDEKGNKISESKKNIEHYSYLQNLFDQFFLRDAITMNVQHHDKNVGKVILYGSSNVIMMFIFKVFFGLCIGMMFMILALWWSVNSTYRHIMESVTPIINIARLLSSQKAYNLRFPSNDIKEFNQLNTVFNQLLDEIQNWHIHLQNENSELSYQVQHDHLTELPNRNYFYQMLCKVYEDSQQRHSSALLFIDNNANLNF